MNRLISNLNIRRQQPLPTPIELQNELSLFPSEEQNIIESRDEVTTILDHTSSKFIIITGPCSIHCPEEALIYAERLKRLSLEVSDKIMLIMRVYFEKPRTTVGWKGLIYDPNLDGSEDIAKGIYITRKLLRDIAEMGLPTATEILDPILTPFVSDLITWAAIGARTTESQTHRQLVSGLSMPVGFKNTTDGNVKTACEAILSASHPHSFLGIRGDGRAEIYRTTGNRSCHIVLRGGDSGPNYTSDSIQEACQMMRDKDLVPNIIVDCSHGNSGKNYLKQPSVLMNLIKQRVNGEKSIIGIMLESNLLEGSQQLTTKENLEQGISITDSCLSWDMTEALIRDAYKSLGGVS